MRCSPPLSERENIAAGGCVCITRCSGHGCLNGNAWRWGAAPPSLVSSFSNAQLEICITVSGILKRNPLVKKRRGTAALCSRGRSAGCSSTGTHRPGVHVLDLCYDREGGGGGGLVAVMPDALAHTQKKGGGVRRGARRTTVSQPRQASSTHFFKNRLPCLAPRRDQLKYRQALPREASPGSVAPAFCGTVRQDLGARVR